MKVCYTLGTTDLNGGARSLLDLIDYDLKHNVKPYVILNKSHAELEQILISKNVPYKKLYYGTDSIRKKSRFKLLKVLIKIILNKIAYFRLCNFLKKEQIDILHNNSIISLVGMKAACKMHIPYICHIRELIEDGLDVKMISYKQLETCLKNSYCTISISKFVENYYSKKFILNNNFTFYDGLNIDNYILPKRKYGEYKNNILMIGTINQQKNQIDAIKALNILVNEKKISSIKMYFYGVIDDKNYYEEIIKFIDLNNLKNNVSFNSFAVDLKKIRANCDIALVCSSNEAMGRVTPEAMLSSELVIGANSGGTSELIKNKHNGYTYKIGDYIELANIIESALNNEAESNKIVNNAYKFALDNFDNEKQNKKVLDIYNNIMNNKR